MPTFLVTKSMSPALAARVAASVSGRRDVVARATRARPLTALLRLATATLLLASVGLVLWHRHRTKSELAASRATLLRAVASQARGLGPGQRDMLLRVEAALATQVKLVYDGDFIAEDLRSEHGLNEALRVPTLYIRGPLASLSEPSRLAKVAREADKDAFVLCMLEPPATRSEKTLHEKARAAAGRGASMQVAAHVERLAPLYQGLPFLAPAWAERVTAAEDSATLQALRARFEAAPVNAAVRAAKASQLLTVVDEPGTGPIELDGERPHGVRVILTELATGKLRLRFRREVDPSWISANVRAEYATGIDSCALALDLRSSATRQGAALAAD